MDALQVYEPDVIGFQVRRLSSISTSPLLMRELITSIYCQTSEF